VDGRAGNAGSRRHGAANLKGTCIGRTSSPDPAPRNLDIPPYEFTGDAKIKIG